jgi:N-acetylmuramoyl-L-alanine amidase
MEERTIVRLLQTVLVASVLGLLLAACATGVTAPPAATPATAGALAGGGLPSPVPATATATALPASPTPAAVAAAPAPPSPAASPALPLPAATSPAAAATRPVSPPARVQPPAVTATVPPLAPATGPTVEASPPPVETPPLPPLTATAPPAPPPAAPLGTAVPSTATQPAAAPAATGTAAVPATPTAATATRLTGTPAARPSPTPTPAAAPTWTPAARAEPSPTAATLPTATPTPSPVPVYSGRIDVALDPGHSVADPGASGGGLVEHELTLRLARLVRARLETRGLAVVMTRTDEHPLTAYKNRDETTRIRLEQEARIAAAAGARLYVSLHFNGHSDPEAGGSSVYYNPDNHGPESRQLAAAIQAEIVARVRAATGYPLRDRGVLSDLTAGKPYGHFFSLRGPFPSVLVEAMFLTNPREAALLADAATLDVLADAYAAGIERYLREAAGQ